MDTLLVEKKDRVLSIILNRPERLNSYNKKMINELREIFFKDFQSEKIGLVIITGTGKGFCAGADLKERKTLSVYERIRYSNIFMDTLKMFDKVKIPIISAINGFAVGGGFELALASDLRIASKNAKFAFTELNIGIIPGAGGTQRLARLIGRGKAKEIIFTGRFIGAEEAYSLGLVEYLVEPENLSSFAWQLGENISKKAPLALALAKKSINLGTEIEIQTALSFEEEGTARLIASRDYEEGLLSFNEKRSPIFKGE